MLIASFLLIPLEDIQRAVFADAGDVPEQEEHPGQPTGRKKPGRKKRAGAIPLLEAAFRLYGWDEADAAEALATTPARGPGLAERAGAHGRR